MISTVVNQQMNNKTKSNSNKTKSKKKPITMNKKVNIDTPFKNSKESSIIKKQLNVKKIARSPPILGGIDLTPLISAILLAGIKLSINQNKQNKNVVEKSKSAKTTKITKTSKITKSAKTK